MPELLLDLFSEEIPTRLHAGGDLLAEEFEKEFGHQAVSPASQTSQQRFARLRTRPI